MEVESFLRFRCHHCRKRLKSPLSTAGKSGRCTHCGAPLIVPGNAGAETAIPAGQPVQRVHGPFKSKVLAAILGLAVLVLGLGLEAVVKVGPKVGKHVARLAVEHAVERPHNPDGKHVARVAVEQPHAPDSGISGVVLGIVLFVIVVLVLILLHWMKGRGELLVQSLKAPSGDDVIAQDGRPAIIYLRSFADDTSFQPVHEQELVAALSLFGPVIAIGRPGEALQTLGAARVYLGDDWQLQIYQWIQKCAMVVIRIGISPGLRWEIDTVTTCLKAERLLLQLPRDMSANTAVWVDRLVRKVTRKDQENYDYAGGRYIFFDKSLRMHLIKDSLAMPDFAATDEKNTKLRRFYRQVFGTNFEDYCEEKSAALAGPRHARAAKPFARLPASGFGIASSILAIVGAFLAACFFFFERGSTRATDGVIMGGWLLATLIGAILGLIGVFQSHRSKRFAVAGLLANGFLLMVPLSCFLCGGIFFLVSIR